MVNWIRSGSEQRELGLTLPLGVKLAEKPKPTECDVIQSLTVEATRLKGCDVIQTLETKTRPGRRVSGSRISKSEQKELGLTFPPGVKLTDVQKSTECDVIQSLETEAIKSKRCDVIQSFATDLFKLKECDVIQTLKTKTWPGRQVCKCRSPVKVRSESKQKELGLTLPLGAELTKKRKLTECDVIQSSKVEAVEFKERDVIQALETAKLRRHDVIQPFITESFESKECDVIQSSTTAKPKGYAIIPPFTTMSPKECDVNQTLKAAKLRRCAGRLMVDFSELQKCSTQETVFGPKRCDFIQTPKTELFRILEDDVIRTIDNLFEPKEHEVNQTLEVKSTENREYDFIHSPSFEIVRHMGYDVIQPSEADMMRYGLKRIEHDVIQTPCVEPVMQERNGFIRAFATCMTSKSIRTCFRNLCLLLIFVKVAVLLLAQPHNHDGKCKVGRFFIPPGIDMRWKEQGFTLPLKSRYFSEPKDITVTARILEEVEQVGQGFTCFMCLVPVDGMMKTINFGTCLRPTFLLSVTPNVRLDSLLRLQGLLPLVTCYRDGITSQSGENLYYADFHQISPK